MVENDKEKSFKKEKIEKDIKDLKEVWKYFFLLSVFFLRSLVLSKI